MIRSWSSFFRCGLLLIFCRFVVEQKFGEFGRQCGEDRAGGEELFLVFFLGMLKKAVLYHAILLNKVMIEWLQRFLVHFLRKHSLDAGDTQTLLEDADHNQ